MTHLFCLVRKYNYRVGLKWFSLILNFVVSRSTLFNLFSKLISFLELCSNSAVFSKSVAPSFTLLAPVLVLGLTVLLVFPSRLDRNREIGLMKTLVDFVIGALVGLYRLPAFAL